MKSINGVLFKVEPTEFFQHFGKEIMFDDMRSQAIPEYGRIGTVVGIRQSSVELRVRNVITNWYPLNSANVIFYLQ